MNPLKLAPKTNSTAAQPRETRFTAAKRDAANILAERQKVDVLIVQKEQEASDLEAQIEQERRAGAKEMTARAISGVPAENTSGDAVRALRNELEDLHEQILGLKSHRAKSDDRVLTAHTAYAEALNEESRRMIEPDHQELLAAERVSLAARRKLLAKMMAIGLPVYAPHNVSATDPLTGEVLGRVVEGHISDGTFLPGSNLTI